MTEPPPSRAHQLRRWLHRWSGALAWCAMGLTVAAGFWQVGQLRDSDATVEREAARNFCEGSNERTQTIRGVLLLALRDPDPSTFAYIQDPQLREGAIAQGNATRERLRSDIEHQLTLRNCATQFPPPPEGK